MISLSDATQDVRLAAKIIGGIVALILLGYGVFKLVLWFNEWRKPPEPPRQEFGELPPIHFGEEKVDASFFTYRINTVDGKLPTLPDRLDVYKTIPSSPSLLALQHTRERVNKLGFSSSERKLQNNAYQWISREGEIIKFDILTKNFEIFTSYIQNPDSGRFSVSNQTLKSESIKLLNNLGISTENMEENALYRYYTIQNGKYKSVEQNNQAQVIRVDLFQEDLPVHPFNLEGERVEQLPVVYPNAPGSTMYFYFAPETKGAKVIDAHFVRFEIDRGEYSDYPIKTTEEAFSELERGDAYIAQYDPKQPRVDITDVELGYFLGESDNGFALPVVRFIGNNFEAYVEAFWRGEELESE